MNRTAQFATAITVGVAIALAAPLAASAHVSIDPAQATPGSYTVITVKVPNESETATTNRLELTLPTDTPFTSVRYIPVAGWTTELVTSTLPEPVTVGESQITEAVTSVIWTADPGSEIGAGELQLFPLSVGPVPDTGSITLPAEQGYTDGSTVSWSDTGDDATHPVPVLWINDAPVADHHDDGDGDSPAVTATTQTPATEAGPDVLARVLGIAGLLVGVVGIVIAITGRRKTSA